jgi:hypothetical protein
MRKIVLEVLITILVFGTFNYSVNSQEVLSLDGDWEIIFDEENLGKKDEWMKPEIFDKNAGVKSINVPSAWELSKIDYEGVAFYKKKFEVPDSWENKVVRLHFGAVNFLTEVWLNGFVVGYHEGGFTPFEFRVDEMVKYNEINLLTLRVIGPIILTKNEIDGFGPMETPQWRGGITGGIWQRVNLIATDEMYIDDVFLKTNIQDNSVDFNVKIDHTGIKSKEVEVTIRISEDKKIKSETIQVWALSPGKNENNWSILIDNAEHWSPENPHLYHAHIIVKTGETISDTWSHRFGMRELTIKNKDFYLNGKKIFLKASFFEGLYPNGIANPDSEEMARKEIQMAKDAGFNMIRPWRRPPVPMWLDLADEMGILVVGSPALECMTLPVSTPYLPTRVENEIKESILRDRNRTCIVQWELFNELHRPVLKQLMRPMALMARELDPTRLILDESGGWAYGANMYLPNQTEPNKFNDIHNYPGPFISEKKFDGYLSIGMTREEKKQNGLNSPTPGRNVVPGLMSYVSELGYGSLPDLIVNNETFKNSGNSITPAFRYHERLNSEQIEILKASGFKYMYPNMDQFYLDQQHVHGTANKRMIEAVRSNPEIDGYCIHALVAGDWILGAGLMDLWRNPKSYAYTGTKEANQPKILSIRMFPRNVYAELGAKVQINGINDQEDINGKLTIEIKDQKGKVVFQKSSSNNWSKGVSELFESNLNTTKWKGEYTVNVKFVEQDNNFVASNSYFFNVFQKKELKFPKAKVAVLDVNSKLSGFLKMKGVDVLKFDSNTSMSMPLILSLNDQNSHRKSKSFLESGGTVAYIKSLSRSDSMNYLPFSAKIHPARGLWTCIPHLVRDHPIFNGLPSDTLMRDIYENVWARFTLRDLTVGSVKSKMPITASIGFDWFSKGHKMHYSGPGNSWWGTDVAFSDLGKGKFLMSQLDILSHLGKDPVADKLLANMVRFLVLKAKK